MADLPISGLPEVLNVNPDDLLVIVTSGTTYKIYFSSLTQQFATNLVTPEANQISLVPILSGTNNFVSSLIHQSSGYTIHIGSVDEADHTPGAPDRLGVYAGVTDSYNIISAHAEIDNYAQLNVKNFSSGGDASSDLVCTNDQGDEISYYIDMGINGSQYTGTTLIGQADDAYVYSTGNDLYIGNASDNKRVIIFNGGFDALANSKIFIHENGTIGVNTDTNDLVNPSSLRVYSIDSDNFNIAYFVGQADNYTQINVRNLVPGANGSADIVATADNGTEDENFVNLGINSSINNVANFIGGPNDGYVYTTGNNFYVGNASNYSLRLFSGSQNASGSTHFTLTSEGKIGLHTLFPEYSNDISGETRFYGGNIIMSGLTTNSSGTEILVVNNSNVVETIPLSSISGTPNYIQVNGDILILPSSSSEQTITGVTITTNGNPVMINCYGDAENSGSGYLAKLQLYRDSTPIGAEIKTSPVGTNESSNFSLSYIDSPVSGTYTYSLVANQVIGGNISFGSATGPSIFAYELK